MTTSSTDSGVLNDIAQLTRMPARATLMVLAASIAVQRTSDRADGWRSWVDHALLIVLIAAITWLVTGLVMVAERRMIATYVGGDGDLTDADRRWRRIRTQVTVLRRLAIAIVVVVGIAAILMTFPSFSDVGTTLFALFDLRCAVREGMVDWVQRTGRVFPTQRIEAAGPTTGPVARRDGGGETTRVPSGLSPAARRQTSGHARSTSTPMNSRTRRELKHPRQR